MEFVLPSEIEKRSFEMIESELPREIPSKEKPIVMRVIHATADFDYCESLKFSENAVDLALETIRNGAVFVTDTNMTKAGINKPALEKLGCTAECFMSDEETARAASEQGITRATASVDIASRIEKPVIYAVGNAPTALVRICELAERGSFTPAMVIGVPVGFVNVEYSKELLTRSGLPYIATMGRKGGST
ncbi:MAG: precorrin-8X methylmutase, partial [Oscillospiraceae bacterium]|nr:precorrin-8X methylmutase [Oscillospiraceae bacterium]